MTSSDIAHRRLFNQHIARPTFEKPAEIVRWLGAVQAQDYAAAKWALGLRLQGVADNDIEQAFTDGSILRTHLMRPTWHFVTPADIRWMLAITAPRVNALNAYYYRKLELDPALMSRSNAALEKALCGGEQLTREELSGVLQRAGIATGGSLRLAYLIMRAELDGIICSGGRRGKQFTYALLEERVPQARFLTRDEALAELAKRFFFSHGPATLQDFAKWSGLAAAGARDGLETIKSQLMREDMDGRTYWFTASAQSVIEPNQTAYLLPNYDEYTIGYNDHSAFFDASHFDQLIFSHIMVLDGKVAGTWKRTLTKSTVVIESSSFTPLTEAENQAVVAAARQFGRFLNRQVALA